MSKFKNIECFNDTLKQCKKYKRCTSDLFNLRSIDKEMLDSRLIFNKKGNVTVVNNDCIEEARKYDGDVILLNMASATSRGGGVQNGANAQEEQLCRRTTLYPSLFDVHYPLPEISCILTQNVTIFKDSHHKYYDTDSKCHIISVAAYRVGKSGLSKTQLNGMYEKIRLMLKVASGVDASTIILSALGCGAYNNDPKVVSKIFHDILIGEGYAKLFDNVVFAIIDDHNANGNYKSFNETFSNN